MCRDYYAYESGTIPDMTLPHAFQLDLFPTSANMWCMNQTSTDGILQSLGIFDG